MWPARLLNSRLAFRRVRLWPPDEDTDVGEAWQVARYSVDGAEE